MRSCILALLLAFLTSCQAFAQQQATVPAVNTPVVSSSLAVIQRQVSDPLDASAGSVTWSFPTSFVHVPTCWVSVVSAAANTVFSQAVTTAISTSSVTITFQSAKTLFNIASLGAVTVWSNPPSGTTATLSCVGALP